MLKQLVKQFNSLDGKTVKRSILEKLFNKAFDAVYCHEPIAGQIYNRLKKLLNENPDTLDFEITLNQKVSIPKSKKNTQPTELELKGLGVPFYETPIDDGSEEIGMNKAVSSDDIYKMITDKMIDEIEKASGYGYEKRWHEDGFMFPRNFVTNKAYRGVNYQLLTLFGLVNFKNPFYLTRNQIKKLGGNIKKGAKAHKVIYYSILYVFNQKQNNLRVGTYDAKKFIKYINDNRSKLTSKNSKKKTIDILKSSAVPVLKYYNIFNGNDIEGIDFKIEEYKKKTLKTKAEKIKIADLIVANYPETQPKLEHGGARAYYSPSEDLIQMPRKQDFKTVFDYYRTLFHELTHSTGGVKRLDRLPTFIDKHSPEYAKEELIAEFGAVFLSAHAGIMWRTNDNHAEYLKNWLNALKYLKKDNKLLMRASSQAQKATDYILNLDDNGEPKFYKKLLNATQTKKNKIIGYALVDNINGGIVSSKKTLKELKKSFISLEENKSFKDLEIEVYEVIKKGNKNNLGKKVFVDWIDEKQKSKQVQLKLGLNGVNISTETFKNFNRSQLRKFTLNYYNSVLKGKSVNSLKPKIELTFVSKAGRKISHGGVMNKEKASAIRELDTLIKNSTYNNFGAPKKTDKPTVIGYLNFKSKLTIDGVKRHARISIVMYKNGLKLLKDFNISEKKCDSNANKLREQKSVQKEPQYKNTKKNNTNKGLAAAIIEIEPKAPTTITLQPVNIVEETQRSVPKLITQVTEVAEVSQKKPMLSKRKQSLNGLRPMNAEIEKAPLMNIQGVTGSFLQAVEKKPKESVAVVLSTPQGTGKTTSVYKWMNDIAVNSPTLFLSLEEHPDSRLATEKRDKYLSPEAQQNINITGEIPSKQMLFSWIESHETIVVDSWQKLEDILGRLNFDKDFRKRFDGKLFIFIFQQTVDGKAKGGSDKVFDGDIIIRGKKGDSFNENYLYFDKNRYTRLPLDEIYYNISEHRIYNPKEGKGIDSSGSKSFVSKVKEWVQEPIILEV